MGRPKSKNASPDAYDAVVIGSGPAGFHAAVQAAKLDKRVLLIEAAATELGGAWIHTGTLPSKTIRETLDAIHSIKNHVGHEWVGRILHDLTPEQLFGRAKKVAAAEQILLENHCKQNNIDLIRGKGRLAGKNKVEIVAPEDGRILRQVTSGMILIATGSRPRRPQNIPFDGWRVVDSDSVLNLKTMPKSVIVYGAGVIGCEYACIFAALGIRTLVVDQRKRVLQSLDQEAVAELMRSMEQLGVTLHLGQDMKQVTSDGPALKATLAGGEVLQADMLFYAAGREPDTRGLGLETAGVELGERGVIKVNKDFQTNVPGIYAAGDVIGPPALAATSSEQGRHSICSHFHVRATDFPKLYPVGVYTIPEMSTVGESEEALVARGAKFVVGRATYQDIARGYIRGDTHGLLKLMVCSESQKILGVHIVGDGACNLVHIGLAFMLKEAQAQEFVTMIFNYPTLAEAYRVAAFNALNKIYAIEDQKTESAA